MGLMMQKCVTDFEHGPPLRTIPVISEIQGVETMAVSRSFISRVWIFE